jgi:predicted ATPase
LATIDWSYELLMANEQTLLRRMAVFTAGCTLDMLEMGYPKSVFWSVIRICTPIFDGILFEYQGG